MKHMKGMKGFLERKTFMIFMGFMVRCEDGDVGSILLERPTHRYKRFAVPTDADVGTASAIHAGAGAAAAGAKHEERRRHM